ncbi:hypothetical protein A3D81_01010 [Candidatus Curtissbacteria bacterium RIFCSPHIGHO2_02_FULL_40_17]|uniref:Glycosyl transferase family 1 domain-containing protein n=4 Tax=Bacteria candidate phyla TaxID=1783234 RepID=A0A1F5GHM0_9BACT|nr:MAG: hypothetical protein A3H26_01445 [candidate division WWE3 bacterium RIFCSPLOWO2_12_FULL_36_10]OGD87333.1 MAG: hypothetical protein A2693_03320 [Candidatus Curtissbacteria bacterium RIFCSPHIGHO2_01_FULL_40_12]OGD91362.1 MAG: hypothetical protein A3D81_01010 [Candidatus Curtissbacteria bacterium RIFCSPHIGHO2_02_FULL_40_17]OGE04018.1 MAG: hypothetical protein A3F45_02695 [Candidatus Curtissbacteria bacterium RIFCSPHIGHO2_12_FULL_41_17]
MALKTLAILSDEDLIRSDRTSSMAIRQRFLANLLSKIFNVSLVTSFGKHQEKKLSNIKIMGGVGNLHSLSKEKFDAVIIGLATNKDSIYYKYSKLKPKSPIIVDMYYAIIFEKLITLENSWSGNRIFNEKLKVLDKILGSGDHFICATSQQKDYLLGMLSSIGCINTSNFSEELVSIAPTIIDTTFKKNKVKKLRSGSQFGGNDKIVLWLGGIYPWFDPCPLIEAMPQVIRNTKNTKLLILGGKHPNIEYKSFYDKALVLVQKSGLLGKSIIFMDWVDEKQSYAYIKEVDLNVILSQQTLEDKYAFRTRILAPTLLGIPSITNGSDYISSLIKKHGAGVVLNSTDPTNIAAAINGFFRLQDEKRKIISVKKVISEIKSSTDLKNLINFVERRQNIKETH